MTETPPVAPPAAPKGPGWQRLLTDLGPSLVFFGVYQWAQKAHPDDAIFIATGAFVPVALAAFAYGWVTERRIAPIPAITTALVLVFSGLALWLRDETFIKMRPTLIYVLFSSVLIGSVIARRNLLKTVFEGALTLPDEIWRKLALRAGLFYGALAIINEAVWRTQAEATWVNYNTFGDVALSIVFWLSQVPLFLKHAPEMRSPDQSS
jgi:intracellular septation protein